MLFYQIIVFNELKNKKALIIRNILKLGIIPIDMRGGGVRLEGWESIFGNKCKSGRLLYKCILLKKNVENCKCTIWFFSE